MRYFFSLILIVFISISCKKESFITTADARLNTSSDTLYFDTVFTSTGSITQSFRIFNDNDQKLRLSNISLSGGTSSPFKINVDGFTGPSVSNIELEANDSVHVFVTVKIDPGTADLAFVVQDSISIDYNGLKKWVQLEAWGQNANFFRSRVIATNENWTNTKPYVILEGLQVLPGSTLTIQQGTRIYLHADAPFIIDGTLKVMGEKYDSTRVTFQGDRLDFPYRGLPAAWPGIYFRGNSVDNELNFTIIKNAYQGIVAGGPSLNSNPKLVLNETVIDNCYDAGILAIGSEIKATNCLISNCGKNLVLVQGGRYDFNHCTVATISNNLVTHKDPVLFLTNFVEDGTTIISADLYSQFRNCIFWGENGTVEDEVVINKKGTGILQSNFQNCLWKVKTDPLLTPGVTATNMIVNQNPSFDTIDVQKNFYSFRLKEGSPAINKGTATAVLIDLDGNPRPIALVPDMGSYEKQ